MVQVLLGTTFIKIKHS